MNLIAAVDRHWGIGKKGRLLVSIPEDQRLFREETLGKTVIMGRKTLESLPQGQPLTGRVNIVLTRNPDYKVRGAVVVHSAEEAVKEAEKYDREIYVIGGESIYRKMLPLCDLAYVTKIDHAYDADTYFPDLDQDGEWQMTKISEEQTCFDLEYYFTVYERAVQ